MIEPKDAADPRFRRPHPDALPQWRRCPSCPSGSDVHELTTANFYEDASRYPWQLSRFSKHCRSCTSSRNSASNKTARAQRSARQREWRAIDRQNRRQAAIFYTPAQQALEVERRQNRLRLKVATAKLKREMLRRYGPRDGIKALIAERSRMFAERRLAGAAGRALSAQETRMARGALGTSLDELGDRQTPEQAMAELRRLRNLHRLEQDRLADEPTEASVSKTTGAVNE